MTLHLPQVLRYGSLLSTVLSDVTVRECPAGLIPAPNRTTSREKDLAHPSLGANVEALDSCIPCPSWVKPKCHACVAQVGDAAGQCCDVLQGLTMA